MREGRKEKERKGKHGMKEGRKERKKMKYECKVDI